MVKEKDETEEQKTKKSSKAVLPVKVHYCKVVKGKEVPVKREVPKVRMSKKMRLKLRAEEKGNKNGGK